MGEAPRGHCLREAGMLRVLLFLTLVLILALGLWAFMFADAGPGVTVTCEGGASPKDYVFVKYPHSRAREKSDSLWIKKMTGKIADFRSAEEACATIVDLARQLELQVELKDKTTVVIYGRDLEVMVPPG